MLCLSREEGERLKGAALWLNREPSCAMSLHPSPGPYRVTDAPRLSASQGAQCQCGEGDGTKQTGRNQAGQRGRGGNPAVVNAELTA